LLLNIGPKPDGTIPPEQVEVLLEIGRWLEVNGEGIYGTRPWKIAGEGPTENPDGGFGESKRSEYTEKDFRFTMKGDDLYVFCLDVPTETRLVIRALGLGAELQKPVKDIQLLGSSEPVKWKQKSDRLEITLPKAMTGKHALGFKIGL